MRALAIAFLVLILVVRAKMEEVDILDRILVHPIPAPEPMNIEKREISKDSTDNFNQFMEEKLTQHTQALEHIIKKVDNHEETIKQLIEHLSKTLEKPRLPVKVEPQKVKQVERRSYSYNGENENPILRLGKNIPIYGRLAKDLFMKEIQSDVDPTPLVETNPEPNLEASRRSFGDGPDSESDQISKNKVELSQWCEAAMLCNKTAESICGFDDNYGYGKFDDICHMLHVNCYYKYNFVLAHTCRPVI